jgi:CAAX protease family protein
MEGNAATSSGVVPKSGSMASLIVLFALVFYAPSCLILLRILPFALRFHVLIAVAVASALYAWQRGYTLRQLGLRTDTLKDSLLLNALLASLVVAGLALASWQDLIRTPTVPTWSLFFPLYVMVFCPAQEFTCRAIPFAEFERAGVTSAPVQILVSSISYAFIHVIYQDALTLLATLLMGLAWGIVYWWRPNLYGVTLSHVVIGVVSILVGLI